MDGKTILRQTSLATRQTTGELLPSFAAMYEIFVDILKMYQNFYYAIFALQIASFGLIMSRQSACYPSPKRIPITYW